MEKQTHIDEEGNEVLLKAAILALVLMCLAVVKAIKGNGDSANFAGRVKWLAIHILKTLPRVFSRTAESVFATKHRYDKIASMFEQVWDEIFNVKPRRRQEDDL
jgi:hypothetical protein